VRVIEVRNVRAVLTDIEGTTTSLAFVKEELFPYARQHLREYVKSHAAEMAEIAAEVNAAAGAGGLSTEQTIDILLRWMDEDRKVTSLKKLQGMIWRSGYESGRLRAHVYQDAVQALRKWHAAGVKLYVYSSGSVAAQRLLFSHTADGDLTPLFCGYFDTTTGSKLEARSYDEIARSVSLPAPEVVFISDHPGETKAAAAAGMSTVLMDREQGGGATGVTAHSFDDIHLQNQRS
jgi:enolase-phosphatase E1